MSREILQNIIKDFSPDKFIRFFREKSRLFAPRKEDFSQYNDEVFKDSFKLGEINFSPEEQLIICALKTSKDLSERSGKKEQYEKGKKILKERQSDAGIFIFYDEKKDFRFSLVYTNYLGKRRDWSSFRRFTYLVSNEYTNKTFLQRIGDSDFLSLEKIKDAFSVEKVTNRFFKEFRIIFEKTKKEFEDKNKNTICLKLKDQLSQKEYQEEINKFAFTFLGRIIFIYFLQRKKWIEDKHNFVGRYIKDRKNNNIYNDFLQPLFFDVFAKKKKDRPAGIREIYKNTPYLNGGLFERSPLETEHPYIILNDTFLRETIFEYFERYNFTIDENTPLDQEVSIDPEMLGKVFENTLAEEERGKKGTFYTPREIVHFMVKESLWQYLINETKIDSQKLHHFVFSEDGQNTESLTKLEIREIDALLNKLKVLDPAVGSAAFPVEMMQILVKLRKILDVQVGRNINEVELKKRFIKNNLYGVDIDPGAIEIAKLRLWLALVVDYNKDEVEPLPNLDFQFRVGNSLQEKIDGLDIFKEKTSGQLTLESNSEYERMKRQMINIKDKFYESDNEEPKKKLKSDFDQLEHGMIQAVLKKYGKEFETQLKNRHFKKAEKLLVNTVEKINRLKERVKDGSYKLFKPDFHFSEVFDRKDKKGNKIDGFDIVIGNPPYGVKVEKEIKDEHKLGSKDSYGVFISTALRRFLKPKGVLAFIVSDTWLTIKSHLELRKQVLQKSLHKIIRVHQDCFDATVNACIISLTNVNHSDNAILAADLTNISTRDNVIVLREKLYNLDKFVSQSTSKFAVYKYKQDLITTNSNLPIFVGSSKLFTLMNDKTCKTIEKEIRGKKLKVRQIRFNGKNIELVRFGEIAEIRQGLATGDNKSYLFQNPRMWGGYRSIKGYKKYLLTERDLEKIVNNDELRLKIIERGFHKSKNEKNFDEDSWFGGRYILPYDKGGESDTKVGWLPNYYVPTNYFIDWSQKAVKRIKTLTIKKRDGKGPEKICSRFQNKKYYFKYGITFSQVGIYSPTYRIKTAPIFQIEGSSIFLNREYSLNFILGFLCSKLSKFIFKNFLDQTVASVIDQQKELLIYLSENKKVIKLVKTIVNKQKQKPRYDYMSNEQKEIDKLVYKMYGLNKDDIREVETWYARRYPKLAKFCDIN